jgi:cobyrinic acid a,c-diamide synthase
VVTLPPRVVVAGTASGVGKTTVAVGLMAALRRAGERVAAYKVGPDYIDPSYHTVACERPSYNLDPVLCGEGLVAPLFASAVGGASVAVVEGVMGLYDGRGATPFGSTAHVARLLDAPVVLVVDASSMSRSVAALVHGFTTFEPGVRVAGVILNRVGSDRHESLLRDALAATGVPVLGVLPRHAALVTPSRHLGLVPAGERLAAARATVDALAELVRQHVDLEAVLGVARSAGTAEVDAWSPPAATGSRATVAIGAGPAFTFRYAANVAMLQAGGADVIEFDPLTDESLPEGTDAVVLGGGFPEVYAEQLAANERMRTSMRRFAASGAPLYAECAGLLYLARTLDGHEMCGIVATDAVMTEKLSLGYRDAVGIAAPFEGLRLTGHVHHRTATTPAASAIPQWRLDGAPSGFATDHVVASYLHLHFAGSPEITDWLLTRARLTAAR